MDKKEKNQFIAAIFYPFILVFAMVLVFVVEQLFHFNFGSFGIYPRRISGLIGVLTAPFIHGDFSHLLNNSIPLLILGASLFYFYKEIALKVFLWIFFMGGLWTWVSAREAYHIGASGVVYGLFSFLLISGFIRKSLQLIAISFFVVFVYGSMVWGIFPIKIEISFEGHFWGFMAGVILAVYYRKQGPQKKEYHWEDEEDDEEDEHNDNDKSQNTASTTYQYIYIENKKQEKEN